MKARAVLVHCPAPISPFDEPARDALLTGQSIASTQAQALERGLGFELVRADDPTAALAAVESAPAGRPVLLLLDRPLDSRSHGLLLRRGSRAPGPAPGPPHLPLPSRPGAGARGDAPRLEPDGRRAAPSRP